MQVKAAKIEVLGADDCDFIVAGKEMCIRDRVEMAPDMPFDAVRLLEEKESEIKAAVESTLGIAAKITLVGPKSIERSEGKAKRVIDKRKLY